MSFGGASTESLEPSLKKVSEQTITATRYAANKIELTILFALEPVELGLFIMVSKRSPANTNNVSRTAIFYSIVEKRIAPGKTRCTYLYHPQEQIDTSRQS
jgi:hypothetical protein